MSSTLVEGTGATVDSLSELPRFVIEGTLDDLALECGNDDDDGWSVQDIGGSCA